MTSERTSTEPTFTEQSSIYELSSTINEDHVKIVEILNKMKISHFYSINKFMYLMKPPVTDETNHIVIYFDEKRDNNTTKFKEY